ncbi:MAG: ribosome maturation factor RimP [Clostridiales bacterium]|jgi:ribosome maturation factor RimP|nr:ribosome maturation factor RimP [Clostridiales bacterium]
MPTEKEIARLAEDAVTPVVAALGYEVVEVRYAHSDGDMHLTLFIDRPQGVSLDDCERVHYAIDPVLDAADPTNGAAYMLDISSAGLDRPIVTARDYQRNMGRALEARLFAPVTVPGSPKKQKTVCGVLTAYTDATLTLQTPAAAVTLARSAVAKLTQEIRFE